MAQMNIHVTDEFERALRRLMRLRGISNKSDAVRIAVQEAAERAAQAPRRFDWHQLRGLARRSPSSPKPRFQSDDDLWRKDPPGDGG